MSQMPTGASVDLHLVVVIPALNEEATVGDVIRAVPRELSGVGSVEVLVLNDGSTDATVSQAKEAGAVVVSHPRRLGVGAAFQTALSHALAMGADLIVSIDADGQFDPATIPDLIAPVIADEADFATASRFAAPHLVPQMPRIKLWGNRVMSRLISRLIGQDFHDVSCGMRCYNRRAAMNLNPLAAFTYTQEVFLNLGFKRMRMVEVPMRVAGQRVHGKSRVASSIWRYGFSTLSIIFRCYRDYKPMRFFGVMALALMVPAVLLELFLLIHYLATGTFSPHKWAGFTGAGLFALGLVLLTTGMIGDMLNRHRMYLEELLYYVRNRQSNSRKMDSLEQP